MHTPPPSTSIPHPPPPSPEAQDGTSGKWKQTKDNLSKGAYITATKHIYFTVNKYAQRRHCL